MINNFFENTFDLEKEKQEVIDFIEMKKNQDNNQELMQMFVDRKVKPHIHATFPLEKAVDALNVVLQKKVSGKVILTT